MVNENVQVRCVRQVWLVFASSSFPSTNEKKKMQMHDETGQILEPNSHLYAWPFAFSGRGLLGSFSLMSVHEIPR